MLELRPYQEGVVEAWIKGECGYLALDAGLGKSRIAIEIAIRTGAKNVLIICPASVKLAWIAEIQKWWREARYHAPQTLDQIGAFEAFRGRCLFTIVNYDKLSRGEDVAKKLAKTGPFSIMVLDEAHYTKNFDAKRTRNIFRHLAPVCERILPMSATPMTRDAADLYAPLRYMKPEAIADRHGHLMTLHAFQDAFCHVEQRRFNGRTVRVVTGSRNLAELRSRMGSFFMRLTKKECLPELPPMQFEILPIGIDRDVQTALAEAVGDIDVAKVDPEVAEFDAHISRAMREIGVAKARPAAQWVKDFLEGTNEKVVLWARHHDVIDALARELAHANPAIIDGRVDQKGRAAAVESFLTDDACRVFIGQIASAGTGLTLLTDKVQPRTVLFVDSSWSPSENYQAASRVHRLGQRDGVIVYSLVAQGVPLDRHIQTVLTRKSLEFAEIMDREGDAVCQ